MERHLLLDLDGTILGISMEELIPSMIFSMEHFFVPRLPRPGFRSALDAGLRAMTQGSDQGRNLMEVFCRTFAALTGTSPETAARLFDEYYRGPFASFGRMAVPMEGVAEVREAAARAGWAVTLATKPIFPLSAILQRLSWCGVPASDFRFLTTAEAMHHCKPDPAYYLEILEELGSAPDRCLMAGNDLHQDLAAAVVGIPTFLVDQGFATGSLRHRPPDHRGTLSDLARLLLREGGPEG